MTVDHVELNIHVVGKTEYINGTHYFPSEDYSIFLNEENWKKVKQFIDDNCK